MTLLFIAFIRCFCLVVEVDVKTKYHNTWHYSAAYPNKHVFIKFNHTGTFK